LVTSAMLLIYGYLVVADPQMKQAIDRNRLRAFGAAVSGTLALAVLLLKFDWPAPYTPMYVVVHALWALCLWHWLLTILGFGHRLLSVDRPWVRAGSEIAYPFYIVHQTVIIVLAHFIVPLGLGVAGKFAAIAGLSLILSWAISVA